MSQLVIDIRIHLDEHSGLSLLDEFVVFVVGVYVGTPVVVCLTR